MSIDRIVYYGKLVVRISLLLSIISIILATILIVIPPKGAYEATDSVLGAIIWYSLIISMWILIYSPIVLTLLFILNRLRKTEKLNSFKKEISLLSIAILAALILVITTMFIK